MSSFVSNMTLRDHIVSKKNGSLLITGYTLYITQMIIALTDENSNYKTILTEIIVFMALLALREYKKHNPSIQNSCTQYDIIDEENPPTQHATHYNTIPPVSFNNIPPPKKANTVSLSQLQGTQINNLPPIKKSKVYVI